jgi:hypothetical protein
MADTEEKESERPALRRQLISRACRRRNGVLWAGQCSRPEHDEQEPPGRARNRITERASQMRSMGAPASRPGRSDCGGGC